MSTIVLAYSGGFASSVAVAWLREMCGVEVVTLTLDLGQGDDLNALRSRALQCGAVRAHVVDAREEFVRTCLLPSLTWGPLGDGVYPAIDTLALPIIARQLLEIAAIEGTAVVAHGSTDNRLDAAILAANGAVTVRAPARDWKLDEASLVAYARDRGLPVRAMSSAYRVDQNMWGRMISRAPVESAPIETQPRTTTVITDPAHLDIHFENGVPVAINGVPMRLAELVESLALIAGRHGVGRLERATDDRIIVYDAPAAVVLHAAYAAAGDAAAMVRLTALNGRLTVLESHPELVNHA